MKNLSQAKILIEDLTHKKQQCYHLDCNVKNQFNLFVPHITRVLLQSYSSYKGMHNTSKTEPSLRITNHHQTHVHMTHSNCLVSYISHTFSPPTPHSHNTHAKFEITSEDIFIYFSPHGVWKTTDSETQILHSLNPHFPLFQIHFYQSSQKIHKTTLKFPAFHHIP
jgi:hypothetical protein